ncbi:MAG: hypothetical protein WA055_01525 [Candidatus Moraniibacteriota bacterium]
MKISRILGENFFRKDLNLKNKWLHRLISISFVLLFFVSVISVFVDYFDGNGFTQWTQTNTLKERINSDMNATGNLVKQNEKLEEIGAPAQTLNLNDLPYGDYVLNNVYCSTEIQNHVGEIKNERKIDHLLVRDLYDKNDVSIEDFNKYIKENNIDCIAVDAYTTYGNNSQETGKFTFLEPNKKFQNGWAFYKKSIPKTVLYLLGYSLWTVTSLLLIFIVIAVIYYKILLYIIFGKATNEASREGIERSDAVKLSRYAKPIVIISIVIILLLGVSFYWFGIRPSNIRQWCSDVEGRQATNSEYTNCLRKNGLREDNLQSINDEQLKNLQQSIDEQSEKIENVNTKKNTSSIDAQAIIKSSIEKTNREEQAKCQQELSEYNSCLAEYNSKMTEYNSCLTEEANPNSWNYGKTSLCFKPSNYCFKPVCAY